MRLAKKNRGFRPFLSTLVLALGGVLATGQGPCAIGDDGFATAGCCQPVMPTLPAFPARTLQGKVGVYNACNFAADFMQVISLGAPAIVLGDLAVIPITVSPTTPAGPSISGILLGKYARTWFADSPNAAPRQVWRFLVNGDLVYAGGGASPIPVPPCASHPVHYVGHIDYACDPQGQGGWSVCVSLTHLPGCISHAFWSQVPLPAPASHENYNYHIVAPAGFSFHLTVPGLFDAFTGGLAADAVRSTTFSWAPFAYQPLGEAPATGMIGTAFCECPCQAPTSPALHTWHHQNLSGTATCGGSSYGFSSIPVNYPGSPLPTGLTAFNIGMWTNPFAYPEMQEDTVYFGVVGYQDPCDPLAVPFHIVSGAGTMGIPGQRFNGPGGTPGPTTYDAFIDLQNTLVLPGASLVTVPTIGFGRLSAATTVWNLNIQDEPSWPPM